MVGWVYIATNEHMPGLIKIGISSKQPSKYRVFELSKPTSIPSKFRIEYEAIVENEACIERATHRAFFRNRVSHNREFFRASVADVILFIRQKAEIIREYGYYISKREIWRREAEAAHRRKAKSTRQREEDAKSFALNEIICAAERGNEWAQHELGTRYRHGRGVPQDYAEAVKWYRFAAERGNVSAQYNLGLMYDRGQGVSQNYGEAFKWFRLSAKQYNALAQNRLGLMYEHGRGIKRNYVLAHMWYDLAASQGDEDSLNSQKVMIENRDRIAGLMTPAHIAAAQALAAICLASDYRDCDD